MNKKDMRSLESVWRIRKNRKWFNEGESECKNVGVNHIK
jgi:hypothetical protein